MARADRPDNDNQRGGAPGPHGMKIRSFEVTDGPTRAPARAMLRAIGMTDDDWSKPQVGVASSWNEVTPCNMPLDALAKRSKIGVADAGGFPIEFVTIAVSDGISMGHEGMRASLNQPIVIEDVTGASGTIGVGRAVRAAPDGYTLSMGMWATHVLNGAVFALPYSLLDDLEPIALNYLNDKVLLDADEVAKLSPLRTISADPKHLGARIGLTLVLHTWGSALTHHPHVHGIVPGAAVDLAMVASRCAGSIVTGARQHDRLRG